MIDHAAATGTADEIVSDVSFEACLEARGRLQPGTMVLFSATMCPPCDALKTVLPRVVDHARLVQVTRCTIDFQAKHEVGRAAFSGITSFPQAFFCDAAGATFRLIGAKDITAHFGLDIEQLLGAP